MQEAFLHYIWRHQYFDKSALKSHENETIKIKSPGFYNENAGPDFQEAQIEIGSILWSGSVEIHIKSSDWIVHHHENDKAYDKVILHVVWEDDKKVLRTDNSSIPTLELKNLVNIGLIEKYNKLVQSPVSSIPCEQQFSSISDLTKLSMLDKVVMERLSLKSIKVIDILNQTKGDWEETAYRLLVQSFDLKVNADNFEQLARTLPFKLVKKHNSSLKSIESLLFGISGFLESHLQDPYQAELKKEYDFLKHKYDLPEVIDLAQWRFLRLRPANFPTIRLAQLATVLHNCDSVFQQFISLNDCIDLKGWLRKSPSDYWKDHYNFDKLSSNKNGGIGNQTYDLIIINTITPLLVAYGKYVDNQAYIDKAIAILEKVKNENNRTVQLFDDLGFKSKSAFDSQGFIHLYNHYCIKKRCLSCSIGTSIVGSR